MPEEKTNKEVKVVKTVNKYGGGGGACGAIYFFGFIGALVYFMQRSPTFMDGVIGVLKAIGWPGLFVFKALEFLKF